MGTEIRDETLKVCYTYFPVPELVFFSFLGTNQVLAWANKDTRLRFKVSELMDVPTIKLAF